MKTSLLIETDGWIIATVLLITMISCSMLGVRVAHVKMKRTLGLASGGKVGDTNYLTGLFFFLLAFTFGMSGSRYDSRRRIVVEEANMIGTALLRADLYSAEERELYKKDFRQYVDARIAYFDAGANFERIAAAQKKSQEISSRIWDRTMRLSTDPKNMHATLLMVSILNQMIDITTTRLAGENARVPESILWMLFALACINSFFSGYSGTLKGTMDWLVEFGFGVLIALVVMFTLDLDRPRRGFVTLDTPHQTMLELRDHFK